MIDPALKAAVVASYRWRGDKHDRWAADPAAHRTAEVGRAGRDRPRLGATTGAKVSDTEGIVKPTITEAYVLDAWHNVIEEEQTCASCGEPFEVGQRAIDVPLGVGRWITTEHLGCAINQDEVAL